MSDDRRAERLTTQMATLRALSWSDRWTLAQAAFAVMAIGLILRVISLRRVHGMLRRLAPKADRQRASAPSGAARPLEVAGLVSMASRHTPLANTCLHRSLALWWMLRRRGFNSAVQFGARKRDGRFEAHAWVEHEGIVISEDAQVLDYIPMPWEPVEHDA